MPKKLQLCFALGIVAFFLTPAATGQTTGPGATPSPTPSPASTEAIIRVSTRLVHVNVIVHDKNGEPVTGLTRDDFTLWDDGKKEAISLFSVESSHTITSPATSPGLNVFSNRLESRAGVPTSVTVILWDRLNTEFADQRYARQQIIKFLGQLQPQDRVALYALGGMDLRVIHDFTSDASTLLSAMGRADGRIASELAVSRPEDMANAAATASSGGGGAMGGSNSVAAMMADLAAGQLKVAMYSVGDRRERTLKAMRAIADHLAALPGRKNLIWISGSFPINLGYESIGSTDRLQFPALIKRTNEAIAKANVAIYPVDARGLMPDSVFNAETLPPVGSKPLTPDRFAASLAGDFYARAATFAAMQALADGTGGRAFRNTNDLKTAIRRAIDDSSLTYELGYYPTHNQWDGRFRPIKVRVKRKGLEVRHRPGYFALPQEPIDKQKREALLKDTAWSPLDATGIGLRVMAARSAIVNKDQLWLDISVDPRNLTFSQEKDRWAADFEVVLMQRDADGNMIGGETKQMSLRLKPASYQQVVQDGLTIRLKETLKPETTEMRVAAFDVPSGAIGFVSIPLQKVVAR